VSCVRLPEKFCNELLWKGTPVLGITTQEISEIVRRGPEGSARAGQLGEAVDQRAPGITRGGGAIDFGSLLEHGKNHSTGMPSAGSKPVTRHLRQVTPVDVGEASGEKRLAPKEAGRTGATETTASDTSSKTAVTTNGASEQIGSRGWCPSAHLSLGHPEGRIHNSEWRIGQLRDQFLHQEKRLGAGCARVHASLLSGR
jgi:hypothetical protein